MEDNPEPTLSASQHDQFMDCARKWGWRYLQGLKPPDHPSAALGTACHAQAEAYLISGTLPDVSTKLSLPTKYGSTRDVFPGQIIEAGLHYLPKPGGGEVEGKFEFRSNAGVNWQGRKDYSDKIDDGTHVIPFTLDHKTTSDFRWAKSEEDLETDTQSILYAYSGLRELPDAPYALNRWVYYRTSGKYQSKAVDVRLERAHVEKEMERIDRNGKLILQIYKEKPSVLDLPPTVEVCEKFGGCPYQSNCKLSATDRWKAIMSQVNVQDFLARKRAEKEAREAGAPPPVPPQAQEPNPQPVPVAPVTAPYWRPGDEMNAIQKMLESKGAPLSSIALLADAAPPKHIAEAYDQGGFVTPSAINPPEAPPVAPATLAQMPPPPVSQVSTAAPTDDLDGMSRDQLKELGMRMGLIAASDKTREAGLRDRIRAGRAQGVRAKTLPPPAPTPVAPRTEIPPAAPIPREAGMPEVSEGGSFHLFVNAVPTKTSKQVIPLSDLMAQLVPVICEATKLPHYRLEEYGKGPARFQVALEGFLGELNLDKGVIVTVDARTQEGLDALPVLERMAYSVTRGF